MKKAVLVGLVAGLVVLGGCGIIAVVFIGAAVSEVDESLEDLSESLANDEGRAYMLAQPCEDVMAEYNAMSIAGHDAAVTHISNVYNTKTGGNPYIAISDASARVEECRES